MNQPTTPTVGSRGNSGLLVATIIMGVLAIGLLIFGYIRGKGEHVVGLRRTRDMAIQVLPLLVFAFMVAGMVQALMPRETVSRWVGEQSGFRGIMIGSIAGGLMPGGPYVTLPLAAGLVRAGAGVATMVAFLTAWSLWAVGRLPMEFGILGPRLALIRLASTCVFPPIAGLIARTLFERG